MTNEKSQYWFYKVFNSKRQRYQKGHTQGDTRWAGPFCFEEEIDSNAFRKWIREHLQIHNSEKIEVRISTSQRKNELARNTLKHYLTRDKKIELNLLTPGEPRINNKGIATFFLSYLNPTSKMASPIFQ
jgi:predicted transposase YbfD/YdcC